MPYNAYAYLEIAYILLVTKAIDTKKECLIKPGSAILNLLSTKRQNEVSHLGTRLRGLLAVLTVSTSLLIASSPTQASQGDLVGLGDSYSTGQGLPGTQPGACAQNPQEAYAAQLARELQLQLRLMACAGATTDDIIANQLQALGPATRLVTITAGGNDVQIFEHIAACLQGDCSGASTAALQRRIAEELPSKLSNLYRKVGERVGKRTTIVVGGYPLPMTLLPVGGTQAACPLFSPQERLAGAYIARWIDQVTAEAVMRLGDPRFRYVRAIDREFLGHELCSPWKSYFFDLAEPSPFHPNPDGVKAYAQIFRRVLR